jgi:hypothetical protein
MCVWRAARPRRVRRGAALDRGGDGSSRASGSGGRSLRVPHGQDDDNEDLQRQRRQVGRPQRHFASGSPTERNPPARRCIAGSPGQARRAHCGPAGWSAAHLLLRHDVRHMLVALDHRERTTTGSGTQLSLRVLRPIQNPPRPSAKRQALHRGRQLPFAGATSAPDPRPASPPNSSIPSWTHYPTKIA